jgi:hypothetical protein
MIFQTEFDEVVKFEIGAIINQKTNSEIREEVIPLSQLNYKFICYSCEGGIATSEVSKLSRLSFVRMTNWT